MKRFRINIWVLATIVLGVFLLSRPRKLRLQNRSQPAPSYSEAFSRLQEIQVEEQGEINPLCMTSLLTHGHQTDDVIVLLHGFTNCPQQFGKLAPLLHERGYNVLMPRLPQHGSADRLSPELGRLTAEQLAQLATESIDIACGLGKRVTVLGFSMSGVLATWLAQHRADIERAIIVCPALGLHAIPNRLSGIAANFFSLWPNFFVWYNPELKEEAPAPPHAIPRFSSRGIASLLRFGCIAKTESKRAKPKAKSILVISNPADATVDNPSIATLVEQWRKFDAPIESYTFPSEWQLHHDLMDPTHPEQQVDRVYPVLLELILGEYVGSISPRGAHNYSVSINSHQLPD